MGIAATSRSGPSLRSGLLASVVRPEPAAVYWRVILWVLLVVGLVLRLATIWSSSFELDSDTSVVYLQAVHFSRGEFGAFFWGQGYGGTLIQAISGAVMVVVGPDPVVVAVVELLMMAGSAVLLRVIAARALGPVGGILAALVFWLPGFYLLRQSVIDPGFYASSVLCALGALAIALAGPANPTIRWPLVGLLVGLAFWQSALGMSLAVPAVVVLLLGRRSRRAVVGGVVGFLVGALPWLVGTIQQSVLSTLRPNGNPITGLVGNIIGLPTLLLPSAFTGGSIAWLDTVLGFAMVVAVVIGVVIAARTRNLAALVLLAGIVVLVPVMIASGAPLNYESRRYAAFFLPGLSLVLAWTLVRLRVALVAVAALVVVNFVAAAGGTNGFDGRHDDASIYGSDVVAIASALERDDLHGVFATYWMAYRISALTGEDVVAGALPNSRYLPYETAARAAPRTVIVTIVGGPNDHALEDDARVESRVEVEGYAIYHFSERIDPYVLGLGIV